MISARMGDRPSWQSVQRTRLRTLSVLNAKAHREDDEMAFEVETDRQRNRISVTLTGFAMLKDVRRFEADLMLAIADLSASREPHQLLYDVSAAQIQSRDVVDALRKLAILSPRTSACALVNASALAGRQLGRIFDGVPMQICASRAEAENWLDARGVSSNQFSAR